MSDLQPLFRTRFSGRVKVTVECDPEERVTKSEFKEETDINNIIARYKKTGILPQPVMEAARRYGDFSSVPTYQEMFDRVHAAQEVFSALPAHVRKKFNNDPGEFLAASDTKEGLDLMIELGLATKRPDVDAKEGKAPSSQPTAAAEKKAKAPKEPQDE